MTDLKTTEQPMTSAALVELEWMRCRHDEACAQRDTALARVAELEEAIEQHFDDRHEVIGGNPDRIGDAELWAHIGHGKGAWPEYVEGDGAR
jgi:hypothetical protein